MPRKKKIESPPRGAPLWMLTYGDMITLVLTFFILLYSYSSLDALKWKQVVASVKDSLGVMDGGTTLNNKDLVGFGEPESTIEDRNISMEDFEKFKKFQEESKEMEKLKQMLKEILYKIDQRIIVEVEQRGVVLRFEDSVLFDKGKAYLKPQAKKVLTTVAELLKDIDKPIRIEGHTDDLPIHTSKFPSNWELSTSRATNVLRYLLEFGLDPEKLSAVGYGEYHPLVPNVDENSRKKNRRVDIVILKDSISLQEPMSSGGIDYGKQ